MKHAKGRHRGGRRAVGVCVVVARSRSRLRWAESAKIADTTIISAQAVPAGDLTTDDKVTRKNMPAFCRVVASVKDAPDSDVRVELWMPNEGWKRVFHVNGNGGYAGILDYNYGAMEAAIKHRYASAETDLGTAPATPPRRRRSRRASG